jgi:hypothetical protein
MVLSFRLRLLPAVLAAVVLLVPTQAAHAAGAHETAGLALDWYDVTRDTVAAGAYPEQVTQDRAWAVS